MVIGKLDCCHMLVKGRDGTVLMMDVDAIWDQVPVSGEPEEEEEPPINVHPIRLRAA